MPQSSRYDAFGEKTEGTGNVSNKYQFAGEQYDSALGDYYLRARYYDTSSGRFTRRDTHEGRLSAPLTLHKYLYANNNPLNYTDPSGLFASAAESNAAFTQSIHQRTSHHCSQFASAAESNAAFTVFAILATIKFVGITTGSYNPERLGGFDEEARPRTVLDGLFAWRNTWSPEPLGGIGAGSSPSFPSHTGRSVGDINDFVRHIFSIHIDIAYDIAFGHAWDKHKEEWEEIGIASEQELAEHIETIMMIPSESKTEGERTAYWDDNTGTIVIENPNDPDGGTAFRPNKEYFRRWPKTGR